MGNQDLIKKKIIYARTAATSYTSLPVEFPLGIGEAVSLIAIHWHIESVADAGGSALLMAALSENPNHEANPPGGVAEFQGDLSLYGMASFAEWAGGVAHGGRMAIYGVQVIPLYGILRPKRQIAVFANIWGAITGIRGEIYYEEARPGTDVVDAINRRYGKYRRS